MFVCTLIESTQPLSIYPRSDLELLLFLQEAAIRSLIFYIYLGGKHFKYGTKAPSTIQQFKCLSIWRGVENKGGISNEKILYIVITILSNILASVLATLHRWFDNAERSFPHKPFYVGSILVRLANRSSYSTKFQRKSESTP